MTPLPAWVEATKSGKSTFCNDKCGCCASTIRLIEALAIAWEALRILSIETDGDNWIHLRRVAQDALRRIEEMGK